MQSLGRSAAAPLLPETVRVAGATGGGVCAPCRCVPPYQSELNSSGGEPVTFCDAAVHNGGGNLGFVDGHAKWYSMEDYSLNTYLCHRCNTCRRTARINCICGH